MTIVLYNNAYITEGASRGLLNACILPSNNHLKDKLRFLEALTGTHTSRRAQRSGSYSTYRKAVGKFLRTVFILISLTPLKPLCGSALSSIYSYIT